MTSKTDNELESQMNDRRQKLLDAVSDIQARAAGAKTRLPNLRKQLGEAILGAALGEIQSDEVSKLRVAIVMAERDIEAAELIPSAQNRENLINREATHLGHRCKHRANYEELKKLITESTPTSKYFYNGGGIDPYFVNKLQELNQAADGDSTDADTFIASYARKDLANVLADESECNRRGRQ